MHTYPSWSAPAAIILACLLWGTTGTAASFTPDVSPLATGAFAMGVGGLLLLLTSLKPLRRDAIRLVENKGLLVAGALAVAVYPLAFYSSMRLSGVAIGTVISIASAPLFTVVIERLINNKPISSRWLKRFCIGAFGIILLAFSKAGANSDAASLQHALGMGLGLLAGLSYALYAWAARQMIEQQIHAKSAMASLFGLAAVLLLPSLLLTGDKLFASSLNTSVALYMAVFPMFLGYLCFGYGLRFIAASDATLLTLLEPALATLMAVVVVGETLTASGWLGIGAILLCSVSKPERAPTVSQVETV